MSQFNLDTFPLITLALHLCIHTHICMHAHSCMLISIVLVFIFLPAYPGSTAAHFAVSPFKEKIDGRTD